MGMIVRFALLSALLVIPGIGRAQEPVFPRELVSFVPSGPKPVFVAGGEGRWDVKIRERGFILKEGPRWHMWFTGYDGTRPGLKMLGYASSRDGVAWTRHSRNPIYKAHWVEDMMVVKQGSVYFMFAEGRGDVLAFPRSATGREPMTGAPSAVDAAALLEYHLREAPAAEEEVVAAEAQ